MGKIAGAVGIRSYDPEVTFRVILDEELYPGSLLFSWLCIDLDGQVVPAREVDANETDALKASRVEGAGLVRKLVMVEALAKRILPAVHVSGRRDEDTEVAVLVYLLGDVRQFHLEVGQVADHVVFVRLAGLQVWFGQRFLGRSM